MFKPVNKFSLPQLKLLKTLSVSLRYRPEVLLPRVTQLSELRRIALEMHADVVVMRDRVGFEALSDLPAMGIEICTLSQYRNSKAEGRRALWLSPQRLDKVPAVESAELIGRSIMYAHEILVLDKMIGRATKDLRRRGKLDLFARGVLHVARQWLVRSPFSTDCTRSLIVMSTAGACGASAGYVDPREAENAIRAALARSDNTQILKKINVGVDLRQDSAPPVFKDRFLAGFGRCWNISHGFDDIGNLLSASSSRSPTFLTPDCQGYRDTLAEIRLLRKA